MEETEIDLLLKKFVIDIPQRHLSFHKKYEKWILPIIIARKVMSNFEDAIQKLESALKAKLKANEKSLDIFTPVLARFLIDLDEFINKIPRDKKYKKNLNSKEAKACTIVQQKSLQFFESWSENPLPKSISSKDKVIIDALEKFLMIPPHTHLSLTCLNLEEYPQSMKEINKIFDYYYSFSTITNTTKLGIDFLTILDLSMNRLKGLPYEILFFRKLKILNISHNLLQYFPPYITMLAPNLEILGIESNPLRSSNILKIQKLLSITNINDTQSDVIPRLMDICAQKIILNKIPITCQKKKFEKTLLEKDEKDEKVEKDDDNNEQPLLPNVLMNYIKQGFLCEFCRKFISSTSSLFLPVIIENLKYSDYLKFPLLRRFCKKCWYVHNNKNQICTCITCKVKRRNDHHNSKKNSNFA
ncbi:11582_t:CDS:2 [Diversispora eburnea]|uniref:11582_t:CDS:1 n=1 Tax=Diversispora eburnea TaxID=1213867 RepID=A0A9N9AIY4_9GLOM|nr:11582_t:CDS:2 [Diversispora eburnea]